MHALFDAQESRLKIGSRARSADRNENDMIWYDDLSKIIMNDRFGVNWKFHTLTNSSLYQNLVGKVPWKAGGGIS